MGVSFKFCLKDRISFKLCLKDRISLGFTLFGFRFLDFLFPRLLLPPPLSRSSGL